jgi:hypothetical protein
MSLQSCLLTDPTFRTHLRAFVSFFNSVKKHARDRLLWHLLAKTDNQLYGVDWRATMSSAFRSVATRARGDGANQ